jgi:hypothetical protein
MNENNKSNIQHAMKYVDKKNTEKSEIRCGYCWLDKKESCICNQLLPIKFSNNLQFIVYMDFKEYFNPGDDAKLLLCTSRDQTHLVLYPQEDQKLFDLLGIYSNDISHNIVNIETEYHNTKCNKEINNDNNGSDNNDDNDGNGRNCNSNSGNHCDHDNHKNNGRKNNKSKIINNICILFPSDTSLSAVDFIAQCNKNGYNWINNDKEDNNNGDISHKDGDDNNVDDNNQSGNDINHNIDRNHSNDSNHYNNDDDDSNDDKNNNHNNNNNNNNNENNNDDNSHDYDNNNDNNNDSNYNNNDDDNNRKLTIIVIDAVWRHARKMAKHLKRILPNVIRVQLTPEQMSGIYI